MIFISFKIKSLFLLHGRNCLQTESEMKTTTSYYLILTHILKKKRWLGQYPNKGSYVCKSEAQ